MFLANGKQRRYSVYEVIPMLIRNVYRRMLSMGPMPWRTLIFFLQISCVFLFTSAAHLILYQQSGSTEHFRTAQTLQDFAQLSLLLGGLLPVLLEDLLPSG